MMARQLLSRPARALSALSALSALALSACDPGVPAAFRALSADQAGAGAGAGAQAGAGAGAGAPAGAGAQGEAGARAGAVAADPRALSPDYLEGDRYLLPYSQANVVRRLGFVTLDAPGVARGFDLDGRVSGAEDAETCGHADVVDPEGREGVDNQLAQLWTTLEPIVGPQVQALMQNAINEGRLLVMMELVGVDDPLNDPDVTLNVFTGILRPSVGNQGLISPDQTFAFDYESPVSRVEGASLVEGELVAGPVELNVPLSILDLNVIVKIERGRVRLRLSESGEMFGYISGALSVPDLIGELLNTGAERETRLVQPLFERNADLDPVEGKCTRISMALSFEGARAFVVRDASREP